MASGSYSCLLRDTFWHSHPESATALYEQRGRSATLLGGQGGRVLQTGAWSGSSRRGVERGFPAGGGLVRSIRGRPMVAAIRPQGKPDGTWALPKGNIDPGESP